MREHIYKAKRIDNGEWVEGFFAIEPNFYPVTGVNNYTIRSYIFLESGEIIWTGIYKVDPNTISQYTGLKDKNGKLIFENDKLLVRYGCEQMDISEGTYEHFVKYEKTGHGSQIGFLNGLPCTGYLEVIGNKFDAEVRDE